MLHQPEPEPDWFAHLGQPLSEAQAQAARDYVRALGLDADFPIARVADRQEAEAIMRSPLWNARWWEVEAAERERLQVQAEAALGRHAVLARLSAIATQHNDALQAAAERHLDADPALSRAAAGAAALALHEQAVARLAGAPADHLFMRKCALFTLGRWPLAVVHDTFHLY